MQNTQRKYLLRENEKVRLDNQSPLTKTLTLVGTLLLTIAVVGAIVTAVYYSLI